MQTLEAISYDGLDFTMWFDCNNNNFKPDTCVLAICCLDKSTKKTYLNKFDIDFLKNHTIITNLVVLFNIIKDGFHNINSDIDLTISKTDAMVIINLDLDLKYVDDKIKLILNIFDPSSSPFNKIENKLDELILKINKNQMEIMDIKSDILEIKNKINKFIL